MILVICGVGVLVIIAWHARRQMPVCGQCNTKAEYNYDGEWYCPNCGDHL